MNELTTILLIAVSVIIFGRSCCAAVRLRTRKVMAIKLANFIGIALSYSSLTGGAMALAGVALGVYSPTATCILLALGVAGLNIFDRRFAWATRS